MSEEVFLKGATACLWGHFKTWAGVAVTPTNGAKVTLYKPGTETPVLDAVDMEVDATGEMVYYYTLPSDATEGNWWYEAVGQDGTGGDAKYTRRRGSFEVK